mgnify:CR=1 FL=1
MYNNSKNCFRHPYHVQPEITVKTTDIVNEPSHFWLSKLCKKSAWKYLTTLLVCVFFVSLASQAAMANPCRLCDGTGRSKYSYWQAPRYSGTTGPSRKVYNVCSACGGTGRSRVSSSPLVPPVFNNSGGPGSGASFKCPQELQHCPPNTSTWTDYGQFKGIVKICKNCGNWTMLVAVSNTTDDMLLMCTNCGLNQMTKTKSR